MTSAQKSHQKSRAGVKLRGAVRLARAANWDWLETRDKRYRELRIEAMGDARTWRCEYRRLDSIS